MLKFAYYRTSRGGDLTLEYQASVLCLTVKQVLLCNQSHMLLYSMSHLLCDCALSEFTLLRGVLTLFTASCLNRDVERGFYCTDAEQHLCEKTHCLKVLSSSQLTWPELHLGRPGWCVPVGPTASPDGQKPVAVWVGLPAGPGPLGSAVLLRCFPLLQSECRMAGEDHTTQQQQNTSS